MEESRAGEVVLGVGVKGCGGSSSVGGDDGEGSGTNRRREEAAARRGGVGRRWRRVGAQVTEANVEGSARVNRGTRMRLSVGDKYRRRISAGSIF